MVNGHYDLVIIGAGSAGLIAAGFGVQLGLKVALLEKHRIGGDCTWTGCVPSKALLKAAKVAHEMRRAGYYGIGAVEPAVDLKAVMARVKSVSEEVYQAESPETLRAAGMDVYIGPARFLDAHTVQAGDTKLSSHRFLIATGARPIVPPIPGIDDVSYLTYETVWDMEEMPRHLMVVGAGPIGCELAQAFCRMGAKVTLLEAGPRVLLQDEPEAGDLIARCLVQDGVDLRLGSSAQRVWQHETTIHVGLGDEELGPQLRLGRNLTCFS